MTMRPHVESPDFDLMAEHRQILKEAREDREELKLALRQLDAANLIIAEQNRGIAMIVAVLREIAELPAVCSDEALVIASRAVAQVGRRQ